MLQIKILLLDPAKTWKACYYQGLRGQQLIGSGQNKEDVDLHYSNGATRKVQHVIVGQWSDHETHCGIVSQEIN